jgi:DNA-binding PadR family transcriptional regulator
MFGSHGHFSERQHRLVEKGDFKYIILDLLKDKPSHGYEIIRALEERFQGFYTPSPGSVYPTLQLIEDMGYVTSTDRDGKKVYTITNEGRKHLVDEKEHIDGIKGRMNGFYGMHNIEEFRETAKEVRNLGKIVREHAQDLNHDKLKRVREIIHRATREIADVIEN